MKLLPLAILHISWSLWLVLRAADLADYYYQNDYDIKFERTEVTWYNHSYIKTPKWCFAYYNRTERVLNSSGYLLQDLTRDIKLEMSFFKFMSNEYRYFPIEFTVNACDRLKRNSFGVREKIKNISNLQNCPFKKGYYYLLNLRPESSKYPPYIPRGSYKAAGNVYHKTDLMIKMEAFGTISDKPRNWKN